MKRQRHTGQRKHFLAHYGIRHRTFSSNSQARLDTGKPSNEQLQSESTSLFSLCIIRSFLAVINATH